MPECIECGKYTKYLNGRCSLCHKVHHEKNDPQKEVIADELMTKKETKARAKATPRARKLSDALRDKGYGTFLEKYVGFKHIDIAIPQYKINIEVDGKQHNLSPQQALSDLKRTFYDFRAGYYTIRIPNSLIDNNFEECVELIVEICKVNKEARK